MSDSARLADVGWVWEGQAINGQWQLSIFGAGEGTKWFGLNKCCFMFHPNTALAMEKLADLGEVVCDISKWDYERVEHPELKNLGAPMRCVHHGALERKIAEAENVSRLSLEFPNITGVFDDDLYGKIRTENITPDQYAAVYEAGKKHNSDMRHWGVVYTHELDPAKWDGFQDLLDVVTLWFWDSKTVFDLDRHLECCRTIFPDTPILIGCYLRDFTILSGVPMDRLQFQWERIVHYVRSGDIAGYSLLGGFLIDIHEEQARWVREFIAAH